MPQHTRPSEPAASGTSADEELDEQALEAVSGGVLTAALQTTDATAIVGKVIVRGWDSQKK